MFLLLLMGFASGLPLALTGATLQAWMTKEGVNLKVIGAFALVGLPYTFKFIWSPLMDRYVPPFLGRRRGWMLLCQVALCASIVMISGTQPAQAPVLVASLAALIAFFSASQDIVIDAYRAEILAKDELGAGAGIAILGYRLGMLTSGALALYLADDLPWRTVYLLMAGVMGIGIAATLLAPEPQTSEAAPKTLAEAVLQPLLDFFHRNGAFEILTFIIIYKVGEVMAVTLTTNFMITLGFSLKEISVVTKVFGLAATIIGSLVGGALTARLGMKRALIIFGLLQGISPLCFAALSIVGRNLPVMALAVGTENFFVGLATAPFIAFLMSLCNKRFTATQYALLTSLGAVCRVTAGAPTGFIVEAIGWTPFFIICAFASAPALIFIALRYEHWAGCGAEAEARPS